MSEHRCAPSADSLLEEWPLSGVVVLRLNRPGVLNALNLSLRERLAESMLRLEADERVRAIVIAGTGRAFCAGADLHEYASATSVDIASRHMGRLWDAIARCRKPVIAAVRGYALGGGCELAMHADIIVTGTSARFGQPEVLIGLMPGGGATQRLTRAVGKYRAMWLLLTGEAFSGEEAHAMGLASEVVPDADVEQRALEIARRLAGGPQWAIEFIKQAVVEGMSQPLQQGLEFERRSFQLLFSHPDKQEGIRARLEKRPAQFARQADGTSG